MKTIIVSSVFFMTEHTVFVCFYHTLNRVMISMVDWCDHAVIVETVIQWNENEWNERGREKKPTTTTTTASQMNRAICVILYKLAMDILIFIFYSFCPMNKFGQLLLFGLVVRGSCAMSFLHLWHHRQKPWEHSS